MQQFAQAEQFGPVFGGAGTIGLQFMNAALKFVILGAHIHQSKVSIPYAGHTVADRLEHAQHRPGKLQTGIGAQRVPLTGALIPGVQPQKGQQGHDGQNQDAAWTHGCPRFKRQNSRSGKRTQTPLRGVCAADDG